MAEATIRRIVKIGNYRAFQSWTQAGSAKPFARVNVLYGTNGSGKSTLASLFHECSDAETLPKGVDLQLEVDVAGQTTTITESDAHFWSRVRVFNAAYVRENLRFDDEEGPRSDSLLTLGKPNVDAEERLLEAEDKKRELVPAARTARSEASKADRLLESRQTDLAREIVEDLRQSPVAIYRATNSYSKANVRKLLQGDPSVFDDASTDVVADRALATGSPMRTVQSVKSKVSPSVVATTIGTARSLLNRQIAVTVLDELRGHADRAAWVQSGIPLHIERETCLFCGNELDESRRALLDAHFDDALTTLQSEIDAAIGELELSVSEAQAVGSAIPGDGDLYPDLAGKLRTVRSEYRNALDQFVANVGALIGLLKEKRANPFQVPKVPSAQLFEFPGALAVNELIQVHDERRAEHDSKAAAAARRVELARVKAFAVEYGSRAEELERKRALAERLELELSQLDQLTITLRNVNADPVPAADVLTREVERLLGRGDLQFQTTEDGKHYRIARDNEPATHLSEGERTAIALLHFLASIRKDVTPGDEPIVIIDDPVSSLDDSILFGVSSFIWSALVNDSSASQLILFTHSFELFRQWIIQLDNAGRHLRGGYTIHEIRMRYRDQRIGPPRRVPQLDSWTEDRKQSRRLRSLYHYLFERVASAVILAAPDVSLAERMDLLALAPNAARKMMEAFLSFKYPQHIGDFHAGMREGMNRVLSPAVRTHVERYLHAYSHNEEGNVSAMVDPGEATTVIRSLFSMMRDIDSEHLSSMCGALMIEESELMEVPGRGA